MSSKSSLRSARSTTSSSSAGQTQVPSSCGSSSSASTRHRRGSASSGSSRVMRAMEQERRLCRVPPAVMSASERLDAIRGRVTELQHVGERQWHTDVLDQAGGAAVSAYFEDLRETIQRMQQYQPLPAASEENNNKGRRSPHGERAHGGEAEKPSVVVVSTANGRPSGPQHLRYMAEETERLLAGASEALGAIQGHSSSHNTKEGNTNNNNNNNNAAVEAVAVYPGMKARMLREAHILLSELRHLLQHRPSQLVSRVGSTELLADLVSFHVDEFDAFAQYRLPALIDEMKMEGVYYSAAVMASASQRARPIGLTSVVVLDVAIGVRPVLCARIALEHAKQMLNKLSHRVHNADAVLQYGNTHTITSHYASSPSAAAATTINSSHRRPAGRTNTTEGDKSQLHTDSRRWCAEAPVTSCPSAPDPVELQRREYHIMKERLAQARSELDALGERWAAEEQAIFERATAGLTELTTVWQTKRMQEDEVLAEVGCIYDRAVHSCLPFAAPQYHRRHGETYSQPCQVRVGLHFVPDSSPAHEDEEQERSVLAAAAASSSLSAGVSRQQQQQEEEEEECAAAAAVKEAIRRGRRVGGGGATQPSPDSRVASHTARSTDANHTSYTHNNASNNMDDKDAATASVTEALTLYTLLPGFIPWMRQCGVRPTDYEHYSYLVPSREQLWLPFSEMPEMVKGARCALRGVHPRLDHTRALEEHKEVGGYFILRGGERILRALLMQRCNVPINIHRERFCSQGPHFTARAVVMRCKRASGLTTQNYFYYTTVGDIIFSFARKVVWHIPVTLLLFATNTEGLSGLELFRLFTTGLPWTPQTVSSSSPSSPSSAADPLTHAARVEALLQHHQQRPYHDCVHLVDYLSVLGRMYRSYHQNSNTFHFLPQFSQGLRCQHDAWYGLFMLRRHVLPHLNVRVATPDLRADASAAELQRWLMSDAAPSSASAGVSVAALLRQELAAKFAALIAIVRQVYQFVDGQLAHQGNDVPAYQEIVPVSQVLVGAMEVCLTRTLRGLSYRWGRHMPARVFASALSLRSAPLHVAEEVMRQLRELHEFSARRSGGGGGGGGGEPLEPLHRLLTTGNFSLDREEDFYCPQTSGWVVMAEHLNFYRFFEQLRCVHRGKTIAEMRSSEVRRYPCEAYGFLCMVHSPDGEDCGVLNHLALSTVVAGALESAVRTGEREGVAGSWSREKGCLLLQQQQQQQQQQPIETGNSMKMTAEGIPSTLQACAAQTSSPSATNMAIMGNTNHNTANKTLSIMPSLLSAAAAGQSGVWQQRADHVRRWLSDALPRLRRWGDGLSGVVDVLFDTVPVWVEGAVVGYVTPHEAAQAAAVLRARKRLNCMSMGAGGHDRTHAGTTHTSCDYYSTMQRANGNEEEEGESMGEVAAVSSSALSMLRRAEVSPLHTVEVVYVPPQSKDPAGLYVFYDAGRLMRPVQWLGPDEDEKENQGRPGGLSSSNNNHHNNNNNKKSETTAHARPFPLTFVGTWEQTWLDVASVPSDLVDGVVQLNKTYEYLEPCGSDILSLTAATIPFFEHNCSPRNLFQCGLSKQSAGTQLQAQSWRKEAKLFRMYTPQRYISRTTTLDRYGLDDVNLGVNAVVAILAYTGYDMDDAVIINHTAVQRGMLNAGVTVAKVITASGRGGDKDDVFVFHNMLSTGERFSAELGVHGLPHRRCDSHMGAGGDVVMSSAALPTMCSTQLNSIAPANSVPHTNATSTSAAEKSNSPEGFSFASDHQYPSLHNNSDVYCCARRAERIDPLTNERVYEYTRHHVTKWRHFDKGERAWVQSVVPLSYDGPDPTSVLVVFRIPRPPTVGDKFSSRHGQKGTLPLHVSSVDLPLSTTAGGIVPDVLINPHAFPSRMTVGMVLEIMAGKLGSLQGRLIDHSAWSTVGDSARAAEQLGAALQRCGYNRYGRETLLDGVSGLTMEAEVFVGVSGYQRLRHMVSDKWQARARTDAHTFRAVTRTGQPVKGRKRHGGVRVGEMERDGLLSHGISETVMDRLLHVSDKTKAFICPECGNLLSIYERHATEYSTWKTCQFCGAGADESTDTIAMVDIPQVLRLWASELASIGVRVALKTTETATLC